MCSLLSLFYVVLTVSLGAGGLAAALCEGRFAKRLSEKYPEIWREITSRKTFFNDGDQDGAATVRYLWSGRYRLLGDITLNSIANRGFFALTVVLLALAGWVLIHTAAPEVSLLACFRRSS
jgi:hypothetical protein